MARIVKTARGKTLDMAGLMAKQERTRAVSNVRQVNARGDEIDSTGKIVKPLNQVVAESYASQVGNKSAQSKGGTPTRANPNAPLSPKQKREIEAQKQKAKEEKKDTPLLDKLVESSQPVVTEEIVQPIEQSISPLPEEPPVIEDFEPKEEDAETELVAEDFFEDEEEAIDIEAIKQACLDAQAQKDAEAKGK